METSYTSGFTFSNENLLDYRNLLFSNKYDRRRNISLNFRLRKIYEKKHITL